MEHFAVHFCTHPQTVRHRQGREIHPPISCPSEDPPSRAFSMGTRPLSPPGPPGLSPPELEGCQRLWWGWGDVAGMMLAQSARSKPCIFLRQSLGLSGPPIPCLPPSQAPSQNVVQWRGCLVPKQGTPTCTLTGKGKAFGDSQMAPISSAISPAHLEHLLDTASSKKHPRINPWASLPPPASPSQTCSRQ